MTRRKGIAGVLLVAATWVSCAAPPPDLPAGVRDRNGDGRLVILCIGDSVTKGSMLASYPVALRKLVPEPLLVENAGKYGESAAQTHARLAALLAEHRPDHVVLQTGLNDVLRAGLAACPGHVRSVLRTVQAMIDQVRASGAAPLVGSLFAGPDVGGGTPARCVRKINARLRRLDVPQVDFAAVVGDRWGELTLDGVHLSAEGAAAVAAAVAEALPVPTAAAGAEPRA